jgi:hypothetical protein
MEQVVLAARTEHYTLLYQHSEHALRDLRAALYHYRQLRDESRAGDFEAGGPFQSQVENLEKQIRTMGRWSDLWKVRRDAAIEEAAIFQEAQKQLSC